MRDVLSGAIAATAAVLEVCQTTKDARQIRRRVESIRDALLAIAGQEFRSALPGKR